MNTTVRIDRRGRAWGDKKKPRLFLLRKPRAGQGERAARRYLADDHRYFRKTWPSIDAFMADAF